MKRSTPVIVKDGAGPYIEQKHVVLCRSGIQLYHRSEVAAFITDDNKPAEEREWYREYRPASVVVKAKSKCGNLPVTREHPEDFVNPDNWRELCGGTTGKGVDVIALDGEGEGEIGLVSDITFYDKSLYDYYSENKEVSLGYTCTKHFVPNPEELGYDIVLDEITEVNHLAITRSGRGGPSVAIIDSMIGGLRPMRTGIFSWLAGRRQKDSGAGFGSEVFAALKKSRGSTDKELEEELKCVFDSCSALKDGEQKTLLLNMVRDCYDHREKALASERELTATFDSMFATISGEGVREVDEAVSRVADSKGSKDDKSDSEEEKQDDSEEEKQDDSDDEKQGDSDEDKEDKEDKDKKKANDSAPVTRGEVARIVADSIKDVVPELVKSALGLSDRDKGGVKGGVVDSDQTVDIERDYSSFLN